MMKNLIVCSFILAFASTHLATTSYAQGTTSNQPKTTSLPTTTTTTVATLTTNQQPTTLSTPTEPATTSTATSTTTTTTLASTTEQDLEPSTVTSAPDALSVNSDDITELTSINDDSASETVSSGGDGEGIQGKSIGGSSSSSSGDATSANNLGEPNAKLSISADGVESTTNTESDSTITTTTTELPALVTSSSSISEQDPAHLDMGQVDKIYNEGHKDEQETADAWRKINKKLKKGIGSIIGNVVPYALNMSTEAKISSNCSGAVLKWVLSMNQLKSWALKMLDASGKPIAGLLEGSMTLFGNYRQCLRVRAPDDDEIEFADEFREYFRGKYCIVQAKPWLPEKKSFYNLNAKLKTLVDNDDDTPAYDKTVTDELSEWLLAFNFINMRIDLCVPSMCTREDIQKGVNFLLRNMDVKARVLRCEMEAPSDSSAYSAAASVESSSQDIADALVGASTDAGASSLSSFSQLGWIFVPLVAVGLVLLATVFSMTVGNNKSTEETDFRSDKIILTQRNKLSRTIRSFSLHRSMSDHLNVDYDQLADDKPLALYGVRLLLVLWIVLVESSVNLKFEYLRELLMLKELIFSWPMQFIINSTLQFDSLILLAAFTMSYKNCLNEGVNNIRSMTKFVIDKYIRLMPSIMVMVAFVILLPLLYRGPVWNDYTTRQSAVCQSTGWLNTVFLQNYLPYHEIVSKQPTFKPKN